MLYEEHDKQVPPMSPREVEDDDERNVWLFLQWTGNFNAKV